MAFLAPLALPAAGALVGGVGSAIASSIGASMAPQIDANQFKSPLEGTEAGKRVTGQIGGLNQMNQQAFRNAQMGQLGYLQQQAQGKGPSIVEMQANRLAQQAAAQQMAQAQAANPMQSGLARRMAMQNTAQAQGDIAGQAAQARLQEIQQANAMLAQAAQAGRGQDLSSQNLAQNYEQLLAQSALEAQRQKLGALQTNVGAQERGGERFGAAMAGGMSALPKLFG